MEGLHARLGSEGRAVVGSATEQVCTVAYLLLNFEGTNPSVHERLAQAATTDREIDEDFFADVVLMVGAACVVLVFLAYMCLLQVARDGFAEEGLEWL